MLAVPVVEDILHRAFQEDSPQGDITSNAIIPADLWGQADLVAREGGVLSGIEVFARAFTFINPDFHIKRYAADADEFRPGQVLATIRGPMRAMLRSERVALNLIEHMSGIATATAAFVREVKHERITIKDTRKTLPGLRSIQRYAVRCGGGHNHRDSLSDAVMMKDNHLAVLRAAGMSVAEAIRQAREIRVHSKAVIIEVEVDALDQIEEVLLGGPDVIMLDNFSPQDTILAVKQINHRAEVEASGTMTLEKVRAISHSGIDTISIGSLTHSVRAIDLGLDWAER